MQHQDRPEHHTALVAEIRQRAKARAAHLGPQQAANLANGLFDAETSSTMEELTAAEQAAAGLQEAFPDYLLAASSVAKSEAAADAGRFRRWRQEQLGVARAADGTGAAAAGGLRTGGVVLAAAGVLGLVSNVVGYPAAFAVLLLGAGLNVLGGRFMKHRRNPLWKGVFADPQGVCRAVWYAASTAAAVELIRSRERDAAVVEAGLRNVEHTWALCNRRSDRFFDEDYSGLTPGR